MGRGKKVKGRKRHILVDTRGNLLGVLVLAANVSDSEGGRHLIRAFIASYPRLRKVWADQIYQGEFVTWMLAEHEIEVEIVKKVPEQEGFVLLPHRWIVERTLAWLSRYRRLSKDYEYLTECSESIIYLASLHLMLKRLQGREPVIKPHRAKHDRRYRELTFKPALCAA